MNRSINSIKKRRTTQKPKSDLSFAPITIKCSLFNQNSVGASRNTASTFNIGLQTQKTLKTITKISNNTNINLQKIKTSQQTDDYKDRQAQQSALNINQIEISKQKQIESKLIDESKNPRKNIYRSRKDKRKTSSKPKITVNRIKCKYSQNKKLIMYYRYQVISLMSILGKRQDYLSFLKKKVIPQTNLINPPLKNIEIQEKLQKQLEGKGKDKARKNFINVTNQQLRSINHKPKSSLTNYCKKDKGNKNQDDQQIEEQELQQQYQDYPDMQTWKRKNNVNMNSKVFIVKGGYAELRNQLVNRGWVENEDVYSKHFDLKWTTKISDIDYGNLKNGQIVNHFNNNHHLTSKYGLTKRLRTLYINYGIDIDKFYPRCYDMGDQIQLQNFIEDYKFTYAQSLINRFLEKPQIFSQKTQLLQTLIRVLQKRYKKLMDRIKNTIDNSFPVVTCEQWKLITDFDENKKQPIVSKYRLISEKNIDTEVVCQEKQEKQEILESYRDKMSQIIRDQDALFCANQQAITKTHNVWIAKPNFLSRGRGIKCFNGSSITSIADYCLGRDTQFVIQKYIQNPLLINKKKFDIRVWVIIIDYSPARIYQYQQSYLRFCTEEYNIQNIHNRYVHLTNNSIQKHNKHKKQKLSNSMWHIDKFIDQIGEESWLDIKIKMQNIIVWSIKACQGAVTGKKGSFQFVGFDFMVDEDYNPWLIQINMSPSMDYSTPITQKLVKMSLKDAANLIINNHSNSNNGTNKNVQKVGGFKCIYQGDQDLAKYNLYNIK